MVKINGFVIYFRRRNYNRHTHKKLQTGRMTADCCILVIFIIIIIVFRNFLFNFDIMFDRIFRSSIIIFIIILLFYITSNKEKATLQSLYCVFHLLTIHNITNIYMYGESCYINIIIVHFITQGYVKKHGFIRKGK